MLALRTGSSNAVGVGDMFPEDMVGVRIGDQIFGPPSETRLAPICVIIDIITFLTSALFGSPSPPFLPLVTPHRWRTRSKRSQALLNNCVSRVHRTSKRLLWKSWFDYCNPANVEDSHGRLRYFMDYASFNHPICCVPSHPNSREEILGVFQWYRIISPYLTIKVNSVGMYSAVHLLASSELISHRPAW